MRSELKIAHEEAKRSRINNLMHTGSAHCSRCGEEKTLDRFRFDHRRQGFLPHCKDCRNKQIRGYRLTHLEKSQKQSRDSRQRAKQANKPWARIFTQAERNQRLRTRVEQRLKRLEDTGGKICTKCKRFLPLGDFEFARHQHRYRSECRHCQIPIRRDRNHRYFQKDEVRERANLSHKKGRKELVDAYLVQRLKRTLKLATEKITPGMLELKREQIGLRRMINQVISATRQERRNEDGINSNGN